MTHTVTVDFVSVWVRWFSKCTFSFLFCVSAVVFQCSWMLSAGLAHCFSAPVIYAQSDTLKTSGSLCWVSPDGVLCCCYIHNAAVVVTALWAKAFVSHWGQSPNIALIPAARNPNSPPSRTCLHTASSTFIGVQCLLRWNDCILPKLSWKNESVLNRFNVYSN